LLNSSSKSFDPGSPAKAELNPLLNPVLEKNLGRWAQVYFTNPPEARERAVLDLLRELDSEASAGVQLSAAPNLSQTPSADSVFCTACDRENRPQQRFCGFCGSPLRSRETAPPIRTQSAEPSGDPSKAPETPSFLGLSSPREGREESDLQFLRTKDFGGEYQSDARPRRWYVLAGVAALLVAGAFLGWPYLRTHLLASVQTTAITPPAAASEPSAQSPAPSPTEAVSVTPAASAAPPSLPSGPAQPFQEQSSQAEKAGREITDSSLNVAPGPVPAIMASRTRILSKPAVPRGAADGTQELLLAQRYLDGKGLPQDPATAARWLWKAVSKQNPRAALLLADLYARGDGVAKSCGQARILLGVASDKGVPDATRKLRELDAGACQ